MRRAPFMSPTRSGQALRELVLEVFRLNGALLRHGAALTAPVGQSQARWQVIGAVAEATRTVPQIARRMGMSRQSVQRVTDLLAKDGILRLDPNPDHLRSPLLRLTPKGEEIEAELTTLGEEWATVVAADLPRCDLEQAVEVVRSVIRKLDDPGPAPRV
jgi:DNA-binding MarR family transcriptional regulator